MANNIFTGTTNNNWGTATNWSLGVVPINNDGNTVVFNASSPGCALNVAGSANAIDFTGYTGTITMTNYLNVAGNVTLSSGMTIAGSSYLAVTNNATLTSNGKTWPNDIQLGTSARTIAFADNWTVYGSAISTSGTGNIWNGSTLYIGGSLTFNGNGSGTTNIVMFGTGTFSGTAANNLTFSLTFVSDVITFGAATGLSNKTMSFDMSSPGGINIYSGSGNTFTITGSASLVGLNVFPFENVNITSGSSITISDANENMFVAGNLTFLAGGSTTTLITSTPTNSVYVNFDYTVNHAVASTNSRIVLDGSGVWSGTSYTLLDLTIQSAYDISGTVYFGGSGKTLDTLSGTVVATGSTLYINNSVILNTNTEWNNVSIATTVSAITVTLSSDLNVYGLFYTYAPLILTGSGKLNLRGGMNLAYYYVQGTVEMHMIGGAFTGSATLNIPSIIEGDVSIGNLVLGNNMTYVSGTATASGTLTLATATYTITTGTGVYWNNVSTAGYFPTITLGADLNINGTLSGSYVPVFIGSSYNINTWGGVNYTGSGYGIQRVANSAKLVLKNGSTWQGIGYVNLDIIFDGAVTVSGNVNTGQGNTITQNVGATVTTTGSTLNLSRAASCTINTPTVTWNDINTYISSVTLLADLTIGGTLAVGSTALTINGFNVYTVSLNIVQGIGGTTKIYMTGTGTLSSTGYAISTDLEFVSTQTTVTGSIVWAGGSGKTIKRTSGNIITAGSLLWVTTGNVDTPGVSWYNFTGGNGSQTVTFISDLVTTNFASNNNSNIFNGSTIYVSGNLTSNSTGIGTSNIILNGTGTWTGRFGNNVEINTSGTITLGSGPGLAGGRTLKYTQGTVSAVAESLFTCSLQGTSPVTFDNCSTIPFVSIAQYGWIALLSDINLSGNYNTFNYVYTNGLYRVNVGGNFSTSSGQWLAGTGTVAMVGTGTMSATLYTNLIINPTGVLNITNLTYATGTITYSNTNGGTVSTGNLSISGGCSLNTNGMTWNNVAMYNTSTISLLSDFTIAGVATLGGPAGSNVLTINGNTMYLGGNISLINGGPAGTANIVLNGNTAISVSGTCFFSTNVNINTTGTITLPSGNLSFTKILSHANGTVNANGGTVILYGGSSVDLPASVQLYNAYAYGASATITLTRDLYVSNLFSTNGFNSVNLTTSASRILYANGIAITGNAVSGNVKIVLNGNGSWSGSGAVYNDLTIDTAGTVTISGTVYYINGTLKFLNGSVNTSSSTLYLSGTCALDTNGIIWNNITMTPNTATFNLLSNLFCKNLTTGGGINTINTSNGSSLYVAGDLNVAQNNGIEGNSTIILTGMALVDPSTLSSSWVSATVNNCQLRINLILRPSGTIQLGTNGNALQFSGKTITFDPSNGGSVNSGSSVLRASSCTFSTDGMAWNSIIFESGTFSISSPLAASALSLGASQNAIEFSGTSGFTAQSLTGSNTSSGSARTIWLRQGISYSVSDSVYLSGNGSYATRMVFSSKQSSGSRPIFTVSKSATQSISWVDPYRIDSSLGNIVYSQNGIIDIETSNWSRYPQSGGAFLPFML